jgi:hypothetical protein
MGHPRLLRIRSSDCRRTPQGPQKDPVFHQPLAPPTPQPLTPQPLRTLRLMQHFFHVSSACIWDSILSSFASSCVPSRLHGSPCPPFSIFHSPSSLCASVSLRFNPHLRSSASIRGSIIFTNRNPPTDGSQGQGVLLISHTSCVGLGFIFRIQRSFTCKSAGRAWENRPLYAAPCGQSCHPQAGVAKPANPARRPRVAGVP